MTGLQGLNRRVRPEEDDLEAIERMYWVSASNQGRVDPAFDLSETIRAVENELITIEDRVALIGLAACQARGMRTR
jgi:hypothetical protein